MLKDLGLSIPHYEWKIYANEKVGLTATLITSMLLFEAPLVPTPIYGIMSFDVEEIEDNTAIYRSR